jgi:uncharacterized protein
MRANAQAMVEARKIGNSVMSNNRLAEETSPYLLQHKDNPVHWLPWGPEALKQAEESGKPILLSIGYSACHWCHVMNRESFSNEATAAMMNENFINVKVDREERPDIDQLYQTAAQAMGYGGGWPLTIFLNAKAEPFFVGGYFPDEERFGQPAFKKVLEDVNKIYREEGDKVTTNAGAISSALVGQWTRDLRGQIDPRALDILSVHTAQRFDVFYGGLTGTPKFPRTAPTEVLWRAFLRSGAPQFAQAVQTTLDAMCLSSLYDHVGGGFFRYTVDERWLVPHFEKMLYDSAAIVDILTLVGQQNRMPLYRVRVEETLAWVTREMMVGSGFASSINADSEGDEGAYYLWTEAEVDAALMGTFIQRFKEVYNVQKDGAFNGRNILNRLGAPFPLNEADEALLKRQRDLLLATRAKNRAAPMRDDKVLADWNGMMIHAFANAGMAYGNPAWVQTAAKAFDFIVKNLGEGDKLYHSLAAGRRGHAGFADDYAQMARAALMLWEATSDKRYLEQAKGWVRVLGESFWDEKLGGYYLTAADETPTISRVRSVLDQATPNANSVMIEVLTKLVILTGEPLYQERVNGLIGGFAGELGGSFLAMSTYLNSLEVLLAGLQIVIIGTRNNTKTQELIAAVMGRSLPNRFLVVVDPDEKLPETHPAFGKKAEAGQPTVYICQHQNCSAPITNAVTLSQVLQLPPRPPQGTPQRPQ